MWIVWNDVCIWLSAEEAESFISIPICQSVPLAVLVILGHADLETFMRRVSRENVMLA